MKCWVQYCIPTNSSNKSDGKLKRMKPNGPQMFGIKKEITRLLVWKWENGGSRIDWEIERYL